MEKQLSYLHSQNERLIVRLRQTYKLTTTQDFLIFEIWKISYVEKVLCVRFVLYKREPLRTFCIRMGVPEPRRLQNMTYGERLFFARTSSEF